MEKCFELKFKNQCQPFFHENEIKETHNARKLKAISKVLINSFDGISLYL